MNKKKIMMLAGLLCLAGATQAQYLEDAMRFSQPELGGSARFRAMGNASTSLGGDLSSITGNPAGLGFFNNSDAGISLNYFNDSNKTDYYGSSSSSSADRIALNQAGVVFHMPVRSRGSNWLNFNLGIGYTRTNDFNSTIDFVGENNNSSYTDFLADASTFPVDYGDIFEEWGFQSYLVDNNGEYYYPTTSEVTTNSQGNRDVRKGSQYQTNFSFGANYDNKLYIGASVGIAGFNYEMERRFDEIGFMKSASDINAIDPGSPFLDPADPAYAFVDADYELSVSSFQKTNGTGYNGTLGLIYRPDQVFQVGFSATTPTWYTVTDDYTTFLDSWIVDPSTDQTVFNYESPQEDFFDEYDLRTPYRLNAGVSAKFTQGLISADVEYVDYTSMKITTANPSEDALSQDAISNQFKGAANFRLGGEYIVNPQFLLRAGYNFRGNPYKELDTKKHAVSAGLGYRISNMYLDLSYVNERYDLEYTPYQSEVNPANPAEISNSRNNVMLTLGFKF
jgi:hypothetical protein